MDHQKPLILITNRFDSSVLAKMKINSMAEILKVDSLTQDNDLLEKAQVLILRSSTHVDLDFLKKCKNLKYIITATSGFDHIDLDAAKSLGIRCFHTPEAQKEAAAELTLLLIMATRRQWSRAQDQVRSGVWRREELMGHSVRGQTLGIIGLGRVGQEVARLAKAIGLKVSGYDPYLTDAPEGIPMLGYEELMRTSQIVSLHVPRTKKTRHMIKKETISWMDPEATLINMSRGDVINEADLIDQLMKYPHFTAALDVFNREPLPKDSRLLQLKNVILTPHIGATTQEAIKASSLMALEKAFALLSGATATDELPPDTLWYNE